jgi:hypothetical protein
MKRSAAGPTGPDAIAKFTEYIALSVAMTSLSKAAARWAVGLPGLALFALLVGGCGRPAEDPPTSVDQDSSDAGTDFNRKVKCLEVGQKLWSEEFSALRQGEVAMPPLYGFSQELNTCVMWAGFGSKDRETEYLFDVLANREIASSIRTRGITLGLSEADFAILKSRYFPIKD